MRYAIFFAVISIVGLAAAAAHPKSRALILQSIVDFQRSARSTAVEQPKNQEWQKLPGSG